MTVLFFLPKQKVDVLFLTFFEKKSAENGGAEQQQQQQQVLAVDNRHPIKQKRPGPMLLLLPTVPDVESSVSC